MDIAKGLYQAPEGLDDAEAGPPVEIEIENPDAVTIGIDGMEIEIEPGEATAGDFDVNLAEFMESKELASLVTDLIGDFDKDINDQIGRAHV